jgi:hypothetical protein
MAGPVWVFDTSGLIEIKSVPREQRPAVFARLSELVKAGRLRMPTQVVAELERYADAVHEWAVDVQGIACSGSPTLDDVKAVMAVVPKILDPRKVGGVDEADPYVLALARHIKQQGDDVRIVTQETKDKSDKMSLNTAAGILGIASVPFAGFLHVEELS